MALTFLVDTSVIKRLDQPAVRQAVQVTSRGVV